MPGNKFTGNFELPKEAKLNYVRDNWIEFEYNDWKIQAKIFATNSKHGINEGRISILQINPRGTNGLNDAVYHFSRGLDFDKTTDDILEIVLKIFE